VHPGGRARTLSQTPPREEEEERERATLRAGPRSEETGGISCSAKRQTLPKGLPSIDPTLLPPFSLPDRFFYHTSCARFPRSFLPLFPHIVSRVYMYREAEKKPVHRSRTRAILAALSSLS